MKIEVKPSNRPRVLIIDALNMFLRSYTIIPSMNPQGLPNGGTIGFLKSLQKLCRDFRPSQIIVCWDGHGGSEKKRQLNKEYKQGRRPVRFNRRMIDLPDDEVYKNRRDQQLRLHEYLNEMPLTQIMIDHVEADDIIAYISKSPKYNGWDKVIVSSDKDFFQLCEDEETYIWRPIQKELINRAMLVHKFKVHPSNFTLVRAVEGDSSDNLKGVPRVGMKTMVKYFPFIQNQEKVSCIELLNRCAANSDKKSVHKKLLEHRDLVINNYKIMQLYEPNISFQGRQKISFTLEQHKPLFNKINIVKMLIDDGQGTLNLTDMWVAFKKIQQ